jgi:hypothetical protein
MSLGRPPPGPTGRRGPKVRSRREADDGSHRRELGHRRRNVNVPRSLGMFHVVTTVPSVLGSCVVVAQCPSAGAASRCRIMSSFIALPSPLHSAAFTRSPRAPRAIAPRAAARRGHRERVDDVGPLPAVAVAVLQQHRGDLVAVGLLADQDSSKVVAGLRGECREQHPKSVVMHLSSDPQSLQPLHGALRGVLRSPHGTSSRCPPRHRVGLRDG